MKFVRQASLYFAAGCFGALVSSWLIWYLSKSGMLKSLGVGISLTLSSTVICSRLVWGGIWGGLFFLPILKGGFWTGVFSRGILLSFGPTLFQLFYIFPVLQGKGILGLALGKLTPVFICLFNVIWGLFAALWIHIAKEQS